MLSNIMYKMNKMTSYEKIIARETFEAMLMVLELNNQAVRMYVLESILLIIQRYLAIDDRSKLDMFLELKLKEVVEEMRSNDDVQGYLAHLISLEIVIRENTQTSDQFDL